MNEAEKVIIRSEIPDPLDTIDSINDYFSNHIEDDKIQDAA